MKKFAVRMTNYVVALLFLLWPVHAPADSVFEVEDLKFVYQSGEFNRIVSAKGQLELMALVKLVSLELAFRTSNTWLKSEGNRGMYCQGSQRMRLPEMLEIFRQSYADLAKLHGQQFVDSQAPSVVFLFGLTGKYPCPDQIPQQ